MTPVSFRMSSGRPNSVGRRLSLPPTLAVRGIPASRRASSPAATASWYVVSMAFTTAGGMPYSLDRSKSTILEQSWTRELGSVRNFLIRLPSFFWIWKMLSLSIFSWSDSVSREMKFSPRKTRWKFSASNTERSGCSPFGSPRDTPDTPSRRGLGPARGVSSALSTKSVTTILTSATEAARCLGFASCSSSCSRPRHMPTSASQLLARLRRAATSSVGSSPSCAATLLSCCIREGPSSCNRCLRSVRARGSAITDITLCLRYDTSSTLGLDAKKRPHSRSPSWTMSITSLSLAFPLLRKTSCPSIVMSMAQCTSKLRVSSRSRMPRMDSSQPTADPSSHTAGSRGSVSCWPLKRPVPAMQPPGLSTRDSSTTRRVIASSLCLEYESALS
mmetsp:Transcript_11235/g.12698  ORF Transcript_11235/g.12698 Transcript_11235/m.12698 type:complete len:389 (-) Transcript_11235:548-1714(-)